MKAGDVLQLTGISMDGMDTVSTPMPILMLQDTDDPMSLIKAACMEYCRTRQGLAEYENNGRNFDLADFWYQVPNALCVKHGFKKQDSDTEAMTASADEPLFQLSELALTDRLLDDIYNELAAGPVADLKETLYSTGYPYSLSFLDGGIDADAERIVRQALKDAGNEPEHREELLEYWLDHCASIYSDCKDGEEGVAE